MRTEAPAQKFASRLALSEPTDTIEAKAFRLYQAAFDRKPDLGGLSFWIHQMQSGMSLEQVAYGFTNSDEFKTRYGANLASNALVTLLYQNVLHRSPDPQGYALWNKLLTEKTWTPEQVLIGFSESPENKQNTYGDTADGVVACDQTEIISGLLACLSQATLDDNPFRYSFGPAGAAIDLDVDGRQDLILSANFYTQAIKRTTVDFFRGLGNGRDYLSYHPAVIDGTADAQYTRTILTGDFNKDGRSDFFLAGAPEFSTAPGGFPFDGEQQYAYLASQGGFKRVNIGIGQKTIHGESIGNAAADGFALALNTPWQDKAISSNTFNTVTFDSYTPTSIKYVWDGKVIDDGSYSTVIDVNKDGINDVIMLSRYDNLVHRVFINDGKANLKFAGTLSSFTTDFRHVQVENAVVADFDGDGYQDFAALYIDRTEDQLRAKSHLRIYINDKKGSFTDQTESWLRGKFQNYAGGYYDMRLADVDGNGLQDIVFTSQAVMGLPSRSETDASLVILRNDGQQFNEIRYASLTWKEPMNGEQQWMPGSLVTVAVQGKPVLLFSKRGVVYSVRFQ